MSSKRGRKRNDNLPPNRARDVQRAFRARRAAHLQALEQRVAELEEENEYFRQTLNLPPSTRPPLGRGPTGKDQPYHDADQSRRQTMSPSGGSSADSPSSYTSSPELGPSLIAPSISSRTMTMTDAGPSHWTDTVHERSSTLSHSQSEQGHPIGHNIPILAPMPFKASSSPSYSDRILSQNYQASDLHPESLHTTASMYPQSYHDPSPLHREWNPLPSDRVHTLRDQGFPESRRFPRPPEQANPSHTVQHPHGYNRQPEMVSPSRSSQQYDGRIHHLVG